MTPGPAPAALLSICGLCLLLIVLCCCRAHWRPAHTQSHHCPAHCSCWPAHPPALPRYLERVSVESTASTRHLLSSIASSMAEVSSQQFRHRAQNSLARPGSLPRRVWPEPGCPHSPPSPGPVHTPGSSGLLWSLVVLLFSTVICSALKLLLSWGGQASPKFVKAAKRKISREDIEWHLERRDSFADIDS